jgi:hypothetical protein
MSGDKRQRWSLGFLVVMLAQLVAPVTAHAATKPLVLTIKPLVVDLAANPGDTASTKLQVKQDDGQPEQLQVTLKKFTANGDSGQPLLADRAPGDDYFDWVHFDKTQFTAQSGVWQTINMTINLPKTAAFDYYYAVTFTRVGDNIRQPGQTNAIAGGTAILVLLEARSPNAKRTLQVASFTTDKKVYEFLPTTFYVKLADVGNVHAIPAGSIFLQHGSKQLDTLDLNPSLGNILPGTQRIYTVKWDNGWPHYANVTENDKIKLDKNGNPIQRLVWDIGQIGRIRIGHYTAHLLAIYDDGHRDVPIEATVSFWVIPWRFLLALFVLVGLVIGGLYMFFRGAWRGAKRVRRRRQ